MSFLKIILRTVIAWLHHQLKQSSGIDNENIFFWKIISGELSLQIEKKLVQFSQ